MCEVLQPISCTLKNNVRSVDVVQLDCEGKDCAIVRGLLRYCKKNAQVLPRIIQFEANHLTPEEEIETTLDDILAFGYHLRYRTLNNICVERRYNNWYNWYN